jgi:pimeloyl-ACP methyl ester carboxylesterase
VGTSHLTRAAMCVLASTLLGASATASVDWSVYARPQRLIVVGGYRINLYCTGTGSPTVVLDNDGDDSTIGWRFVQPRIGENTRVCSYDSPGIGFSDPVPGVEDADAWASRLHALLARAGIASPIVLVGYGYSGLSARIYADRYPKDVAGMVLANPEVPNQNEREAAIVPVLQAAFAQVVPFDESCERAAETGLMRPGNPAFEQCMYAPPGSDLPTVMRALIAHQWERPGAWRVFTSIDRAAAASSSEVLREQRSYGHMPLIVLTSDVNVEHLPFPAGQMQQLATAWKRWRDDVARLSRQGTNFVIAGSSVNMAIDRPTSIVSAVWEVVDQVRASSTL